jgi:hypothetical protein
MKVNRKSTLVLIDSGILSNFISTKSVRLLRIKAIARKEVTIQGIDSKPFKGKIGKITKETTSTIIETILYLSTRVQFSILEIEKEYIVLGIL